MSRYDWNNPPPPGTEFDSPDDNSNISSQKNDATNSSDQGSNKVAPSVINPVSQVREDELSSEKARLRSRSKSPERRKRRRRSRSYSRRSRSYSRDRRRRSRSRRRRRKYSSSKSRSRSRTPSHRHRQKRHGRRSSRSRSHNTKTKSNRSRSNSRSRSYRRERDRRSPKARRADDRLGSDYADRELDGDLIGEEDMKIEGPDEELPIEPELEADQGPIPFKNDGSFLEMFKRMQEQQKATEEPPQEVPKKPLLPAFGKRRGGKVLKTGMVAKVRNIEEETSTNAQDAWSVYMKEVRKYKEVHCDDDSKTRPLVK